MMVKVMVIDIVGLCGTYELESREGRSPRRTKSAGYEAGHGLNYNHTHHNHNHNYNDNHI